MNKVLFLYFTFYTHNFILFYNLHLLHISSHYYIIDHNTVKKYLDSQTHAIKKTNNLTSRLHRLDRPHIPKYFMK